MKSLLPLGTNTQYLGGTPAKLYSLATLNRTENVTRMPLSINHDV